MTWQGLWGGWAVCQISDVLMGVIAVVNHSVWIMRGNEWNAAPFFTEISVKTWLDLKPSVSPPIVKPGVRGIGSVRSNRKVSLIYKWNLYLNKYLVREDKISVPGMQLRKKILLLLRNSGSIVKEKNLWPNSYYDKSLSDCLSGSNNVFSWGDVFISS